MTAARKDGGGTLRPQTASRGDEGPTRQGRRGLAGPPATEAHGIEGPSSRGTHLDSRSSRAGTRSWTCPPTAPSTSRRARRGPGSLPHGQKGPPFPWRGTNQAQRGPFSTGRARSPPRTTPAGHRLGSQCPHLPSTDAGSAGCTAANTRRDGAGAKTRMLSSAVLCNNPLSREPLCAAELFIMAQNIYNPAFPLPRRATRASPLLLTCFGGLQTLHGGASVESGLRGTLCFVWLRGTFSGWGSAGF